MRATSGIRLFGFVLLGMMVGSGSAQQPIATMAQGSVAGHVICGDTQKPARFADVALLRRPETVSSAGGKKNAAEAAHPVTFVGGKSGLDGSFTLANVPVGDYYMVAKLAGYIVPLIQPEDLKAAAADPNKVLEGVPLVHVTADRTTEVELTMQHGGVIAGQVRFDDGTPVVDVTVNVEPEDGRDPMNTRFLPLMHIVGDPRSTLTDDQGSYRVVGLPAGKYRVSVTIDSRTSRLTGDAGGHLLEFRQNSITPQEFTIYHPDVLRKAEAKVIELKRDEQHGEEDIEVELQGLHAVHGRVLAKEDRRPLNVGQVALVDANDKEFRRETTVQPDGSFELEYLPEGTYTISVRGAEEIEAGSLLDLEPKVLKRFQGGTVSVIVTDQDVIADDVLLPEVRARDGAGSVQ